MLVRTKSGVYSKLALLVSATRRIGFLALEKSDPSEFSRA